MCSHLYNLHQKGKTTALHCIFFHLHEQYIINYGLSYFPLAEQLLIMAQSGICDLLLEGLFKEIAEIITMSLSF